MPPAFFDERAEQSAVKTAIVAKYFKAWSQVILGHLGKSGDKKIGYIDLFAGPGRYKDGSKSTPLFILELALKEPSIRNSLLTFFNDKEKENTSSLLAEIKKIPDIKKLKHQPEVYTNEVGDNIVKKFESINLIPTLMFVDPWGYKGLSLRLINSVLRNWACECIFFFNYNRINMGLSNELVKEHMAALFGVERARKLNEILEDLSSEQRELTIIEELWKALVEMGGKYVLPFRFRDARGNRTSHHLIFVSKHPLGYKIMKNVMAKESSTSDQGVPSFEYSPATEQQPMLFELARPLDDLEEMLIEEFAGQSLSMGQIYEKHNYGRNYIDKNYKDVLYRMEVAGEVTADPPHTSRRRNTFADQVMVTFPKSKRG